jgi:hypothetical protein
LYRSAQGRGPSSAFVFEKRIYYNRIMFYIFLDQSGDLGFNFKKKRTTKYFVITFLFCLNKRPIEKCVKKTYCSLMQKYKKKGILHAYSEEISTRKKLLKFLSEKECKIMTIYLNKEKVYTKLQEEKAVLYNYVSNILLDRIFSKKIIPINDEVKLIASRRETNKFLNNNFKNYLKDKVQSGYKLNIEVLIKTPEEEKSLQAVDFISWAIFRKYEYGDCNYYDLIKKKISEENPLFP